MRYFSFYFLILWFLFSCNSIEHGKNFYSGNATAISKIDDDNKILEQNSIKKKSNKKRTLPRFRDNLNSPSSESIIQNIDQDMEDFKTSLQNFDKDEQTVLELYKQIQKPAQIFSIDPKKETMIVCKEGTRLTFPAFGFTFEDGSPVKDSVKFEVREFLSKEDFLLANLTTSSDGKMLESGGMLDIKALSEGKAVKLKSNALVKIEIPTNQLLPDMELFYGEHDAHGKVNWKKAGKSKITKKAVIRRKPKPTYASLSEVYSFKDVDGNLFDEFKDIHEWADSARGLDKLDSVEFSFSLNRRGEVSDYKIYKNSKLIKNYKARIYYRDYCNLGLSNTYIKRYTNDLAFNKNYYVQIRGIPNEYTINENQLKRIKKQIKQTDGPVTAHVKHVYSRRDTLLSYHYSKYRESLRWASNEYLKSDTSAMKTAEASYYAFGTSQLNWINVDRFHKPKFLMVPFAVKTEDGKYADVKIVFNRINSIIPGYNSPGKSDFGNMPVGERVTIVAIMVKDGTTFLATKDTQIQKGVIDDLNFQPVSLQELKAKIAKIH